jgi:hypothetical protein
MLAASRRTAVARVILATAMIAVLTVFAAWATDYRPDGARSAGRAGYTFVAKHAPGGAHPRLTSRGPHLTSGKMRAREVLRCAILAATGVVTTPSILFPIGSLVADALRPSSTVVLPLVRAPPWSPPCDGLFRRTVSAAALPVGGG